VILYFSPAFAVWFGVITLKSYLWVHT